jgi:hypothetical protein
MKNKLFSILKKVGGSLIIIHKRVIHPFEPYLALTLIVIHVHEIMNKFT